MAGSPTPVLGDGHSIQKLVESNYAVEAECRPLSSAYVLDAFAMNTPFLEGVFQLGTSDSCQRAELFRR